jgi:hypothetical protein
MRARTLLIQETEKVLREVDVVLGSDDLLRTNLTGHPSMVVRCGTQELRREKKEGEEDTATPMAPRTIKLTAKYFSESILVSLGHHLQMALPPEPVLPAMFR